MRTRINRYEVQGRQINTFMPNLTIEDIRLIVNEDKKIVITSSMQKDNITIEGGVITYTDALPISEVGDKFTIEIDKGETINDILGDVNVILSDVAEGKKQIADAINTKGGNSTPEESFQQLAEDIESLPTSGILANGIVQDAPFTLVNALFSSFSKITEIYVEDVLTIASMLEAKTVIGTIYALFPNLRSITLKKTNYFAMNRNMIPACTNFILPSTTSYVAFVFNSAINVEVGTLIKSIEPFYNTNNKLRNFTIGAGTDVNLPFQNWAAANVIAEGQSGIDELNNNLYNNLLTKLYDHSTDGQTRTLRLGWLAHVTQENIDYANSKGWTLTT